MNQQVHPRGISGSCPLFAFASRGVLKRRPVQVIVKSMEQSDYVWAEIDGKEGILPRSWLMAGECMRSG